MTTELTEVQIEEIIKAGNEAKSNNNGKIPYGFNAELAEKYGRTPQSISQIISGKRRSKKKTPPKNPPKVPEKKEEKEDHDYSSLFAKKPEYNLPTLVDIRIFVQDNETDPICKRVYQRLFLNRKDIGVYKDFYIILNEMNKKNKY